ncbi:MAG: biotin--[acetyl-CoA-carboxylase] ligase [Gemmatimonadales bacterium]
MIWQGKEPGAWAEAWAVPVVEIYESIGSTNDRALDLAASVGGALAVVIADEQTAGRGRRGARWHSPPGGGLWMSLVLPSPRPSPHASLLVGLAVAEAIEALAPEIRVGIKWPNDLMVRGGKLGGILCESTGAAIVAGIGINVRALGTTPATSLAYRATSLEVECGKSFATSDLAGCIVERLKGRSWGLDAEVSEALAGRDALLGAAVETEEHGAGVARGIDRSGALILERPDGSRVRVVAGSVRAL